MFDIKTMTVRGHVPYVEMMVKAKSIVDAICNGDPRNDLCVVGAEYIYYANMVELFTNVKCAEFEDDIDEFMNMIYCGGLLDVIKLGATEHELAAFERAVRRGVERYYAKPEIDRLLEKASAMLDGLQETMTGVDVQALMGLIAKNNGGETA